MLVATFEASTGWAGKTITHEGEVFILEGHGPITAADVMAYDGKGQLVWANDGARAWVGAKARSALPGTPAAHAPIGPTTPGSPAPRSAPTAARAGGDGRLSRAAGPWWKRPALTIPLVIGIVALITVASVVAWNAKVTSNRREAARGVLAPFQELATAVGDEGTTLDAYTSLVGTAQHYFDDYRPEDDAGKRVKGHLKEALTLFKLVNTGWQIETIAGPSIASPAEGASQHAGMWKLAVEDVRQAEDDAGL